MARTPLAGLRGGPVKITLRDEELKKRIRAAGADGVKRAAAFYHMRCRQAVSVPNTGRSVRYRDAAGKRRSRTIYPNPSRPGEPPRLRTGTGKRHVVWGFNASQIDPAARIGVLRGPGIYMFFLELGTARVAARPWLVATLLKNMRMIERLLASKMPPKVEG